MIPHSSKRDSHRLHPSSALFLWACTILSTCIVSAQALGQSYPPRIDEKGFVHSGMWPGGPPSRIVDRADLRLDFRTDRVIWVNPNFRDPSGSPDPRPAPEFLHPRTNPYFDEMQGLLQEMHVRLIETDRWAGDQFNRLDAQNMDRMRFRQFAAANNNIPLVLVIDIVGNGDLDMQARRIRAEHQNARENIVRNSNARFEQLVDRLRSPARPGTLPDMPPPYIPERRPDPGPSPNTIPRTSSTNTEEFYSPRWGMHYRRIFNDDGTFHAVVSRPPTPGMGAAVIGFEPGDKITSMDNLPFRSNADIENHINLTDVDFVDTRTNRPGRRSVNLLP